MEVVRIGSAEIDSGQSDASGVCCLLSRWSSSRVRLTTCYWASKLVEKNAKVVLYKYTDRRFKLELGNLF